MRPYASFSVVQNALGGLPCSAAGLGLITPDVRALRDQVYMSGTKIFPFAFDGHSDKPYLPENHSANAVVLTATHDNDTIGSFTPPTLTWPR